MLQFNDVELFELVANNIQAVLAITLCDGQNNVVYINVASRSILGQEPWECIGKPLFAVLNPHSIDKAEVAEFCDRIGTGHESLEYRIVMDQGIKHLSHSWKGVEYGGQQLAISFIRDVTERRLVEHQRSEAQVALAQSLQLQLDAEAALQDSEACYRAIFWAMPTPMYTWQMESDDLVLVDFNNAALAITQDRIAEWRGTKAGEFYSDEPVILGDMERCCERQVTISRETWHTMRTTGELRYMRRHCVFAPPNRVVVITEDMTSRQELIEKQRELVMLKDQFIQNVSHELRTPVSIIFGYLSLMVGGSLGELPDGIAGPVDIIFRKAKFLTDMINNYLLIFRLDHMEDTALKAFQPVDLAEVVRGLAQDFQVMADQAGLSLELGQVEDVTITGNPDMIQLACNNLIVNAIKFTETGRVTLSVYRSGEAAIIAVADTGIGIADDQHEKIFGRFYQVDGSATRTVGGMGLGLSVVRSIMRVHGGSVEVKSRVGRGSTFSLVFPGVEHG